MQATAAVMTPRGRGAVATIRYCGPCEFLDSATSDAPTLFRAANGKLLALQPLNRIIFGEWGTGTSAESVVICRRAPQELEIHCHGGDAAVQRILGELQQLGTHVQTWREMQSAQQGTSEFEYTEALSRAVTLRTAASLLQQQTGLLRQSIEQLLAISWSVEGRREMELGLHSLLEWANFGLHLTVPWSVVLAGRPNVGKSSLINALIGYSRSVVFDQPGTTRDVVTADTAFEGWPVRLADTAGMRDDAVELEAEGISRAHAQLANADCRVLVFDASRPPHADDFRLIDAWPDALPVAHKADLPSVWEAVLPAGAISVSSHTGQGLADVAAAIVTRLIPRHPPASQAIPISPRQVACLNAAQRALTDVNSHAFREALQNLLN